MGRKSTKIILSDESSGSECASVKVKSSNIETTAKTPYDKLKERWQVEPWYKLSMNKLTPECISAYPLSIRTEGTLLDWLNSSEFEENDRKLHSLHVIHSDDTVPTTILEPFRAIATSSFECTDSNKDIIDLYINACGPVWVSSICPTNKSSGEATASADSETFSMDKYIAVGVSGIGHPTSTSHGADIIHTLGEVEKSGNLLQIWHVYGEYRLPVRTVVKSSLTMNCNAKKKTASQDPNFVPKKLGRPRKYPKVEGEEEKTPKKKRGKKAAADAMEVDESPADTTSMAMDVEATVDEQVLVNTVPGSDVHAELVYCVALKDRGPTWSAEWSPAPLLTASDSGPDVEVLGLLAITSGDGGCMILQLPKAAPLSSRIHPSALASDYLSSIPVIPEEAVRVYEVRIPGQVMTSVAWSPSQAGQFCCGMADGSVTVWNLAPSRGGTTAVTAVSTPTMHLVDIQQYESKLACMAAVRSISYCPYDGSLVLVAGQDDVKVSAPHLPSLHCTAAHPVEVLTWRWLQGRIVVDTTTNSPATLSAQRLQWIWSLKDYLKPVFSKKMNASIVASCWDPCGYGFYTGDCETTGMLWNPLWAGGFRGIHRKELYSHSLQYGAVWATAAVVCDEQSFVLSVGADGTVRGGLTAIMALMKNRNTAVLECFRLESVTAIQDQAALGTTSSNSGSNSSNNGIQCSDALEVRVSGRSKSVPHSSTEERFSECPGAAVQCVTATSLPHSTTTTVEDCPIDRTSSVRKQQRGRSQTVAAAPFAPLVLTAYGTVTGLLRIHTIDALRCLFANPVSS